MQKVDIKPVRRGYDPDPPLFMKPGDCGGKSGVCRQTWVIPAFPPQSPGTEAEFHILIIERRQGLVKAAEDHQFIPVDQGIPPPQEKGGKSRRNRIPGFDTVIFCCPQS